MDDASAQLVICPLFL